MKHVNRLNLIFVILFTLALSACGTSSSDGSGTSAGGAPVVLRNDSFEPGDIAAFQAGFIVDEEAAATLGPVTIDSRINKVQLLFGGAATMQTVTLKIYAESGIATPGTILHMADYPLTGADATLQEIDISGSNVTVAAGNSFRVSIKFNHAGLPSVARGDGTIIPARNWVYSMATWFDADMLALPSNFIIRAEVEPI